MDTNEQLTAQRIAAQLGITLDELYRLVVADLVTIGQAAGMLDVTPEAVYKAAQHWPRYIVGEDTGVKALRLIPRADVEHYRARMATRKRPGPKEAAA